MSKDLKFEKSCDHRIIEELLLIESDYKTIKIPRFIVSRYFYCFVITLNE